MTVVLLPVCFSFQLCLSKTKRHAPPYFDPVADYALLQWYAALAKP
jgi:hypothetical protein